MAEQADLIAAFDDCVSRLNSGETVDDCLRRYARFAESLRPMLEAGLLVQRSLYPAQEVAQAQYRSHMRIAQAAANVNRPRTAPARRWLGLAASLLIVTLSILTGVGIAAENSLPGDAIYPVKRLTESLRSLLPDVNEDTLNTRRLDEVRQLLALRREANITFEGAIEQIDGENWLIEGIAVRVTLATSGAGNALIGDTVRVEGSTSAEGVVLASSIDILTQHPTPTPSMTPFATNTSPAPSPTSLTLTPTATQTATPSATQTATPTPPISTTAALCPPTLPEGWVTYTIRAGDTLSELAAVTGTTIETIVSVNCLDERRLIIVGNPLFLPSMPPTSAPQIAPTQPPALPTSAPQNPPPNSGNSNGDNGSGDDNGGDSGDGNDDDNSGPGGDDDDDDNSGPGGGDDD